MWSSCLLLLTGLTAVDLPPPQQPGGPRAPIVETKEEVPFSKWLPSGEYQRLFNAKLAEKRYPAKVEGKQGDGQALYRGQFLPRPLDLSFVSCHGVTEAEYRQRAAKYRQAGYENVSSSSFVDSAGTRRYCSTWVKDRSNEM